MYEKENSRICDNKNIILFFVGKFISLFGSSIYAFAVGLYVLRITGSALSFATTLIFSILPVIFFSPIAGIITDRYNKKTIVVLGDFFNGVLFIVVFLISRRYGLQLWLIYTSAFLTMILALLCNISLETAKPNIVAEQLLMKVNSIGKIMDSLSNIMAPVVGGIVYSIIDIHSFILINGLSFIVAAVSEWMLDFNYNVDDSVQHTTQLKQGRIIDDFIDGIKYIMDKRFIVPMLSIFVMINFFLGFCIMVPLPFIINNHYGYTSRIYGIIQGVFPVGLILGSVLVNYVMDRVSYKDVMMCTSIGLSIIIILMGIPLVMSDIKSGIGLIVYYATLLGMTGVIIAMIDIPILYILQSKVEEAYRGRVFSVTLSVCKVVSPLAYLLSGLLMGGYSIGNVVLIGGICFLILNIFLGKSKGIKALGDL